MLFLAASTAPSPALGGEQRALPSALAPLYPQWESDSHAQFAQRFSTALYHAREKIQSEENAFLFIYLSERPPHERVKGGYSIQSTGFSSRLSNGSLFPPFFEANAAFGEQGSQTSSGSQGVARGIPATFPSVFPVQMAPLPRVRGRKKGCGGVRRGYRGGACPPRRPLAAAARGAPGTRVLRRPPCPASQPPSRGAFYSSPDPLPDGRFLAALTLPCGCDVK